MIITCEECRTQFQLDDSRIPERGARVRCSRCKHAFFVKPTSAAGDPVQRVVEQSLADDEEERAGSTQELGPAAAMRGEPEHAGPLDNGLEESDWKFNDESPDPEPGLAAAQDVVDDLLGSVDEASSGGADDGLLYTDAEVDDEVDSLLGSTDYTGGDTDLEEEEPAALAAAEEPEAPPPVEAAVPAAAEDLGSPENWDFFSDEPEDMVSGEAASERIPIGRISLSGQPTLERPPIDVDAEPSKTRHGLRRAVHAAGWLSVAVLLLGGLHGGIVTQPAEPLATRTAQTVAGFEAIAVEGRWLDNAAAGPIYVISGELHRAGTRPAVPGAWLAVRLLDENGVLLAEQAAAVGPALPEAWLREQDPRELRAAQAQEALAMAGAPLVPGNAWAFHAIVSDLPEAASRFDLAAIPVEQPPLAPEDLSPQPEALNSD